MSNLTNASKRGPLIAVACCMPLACGQTVGPSVTADVGTQPESSNSPATHGGPPICDGSSKLRLRFFVRPSAVLTGGAIYIENGNSSFAVDGHCRYWINGGFDAELQARPLSYAKPWRTGLLPEKVKKDLDAVLDLEHLEHLSSCPFSPTLRDASALRIRSEYSAVECQGNAELANTDFGRAWSLIERSTLYADGTDLDGPIRIVGYPTTPDEFGNLLQWPLSVPVTEYHVEMVLGTGFGLGLLVSEVEDATKLRLLRQTDMIYRETHPEYQLDGIYVQDGDDYAKRDAIPYEGDDGLLPFSD